MLNEFRKGRIVVRCKSEDVAKELVNLILKEFPEMSNYSEWSDGRTRWTKYAGQTTYGFLGRGFCFGTTYSWSGREGVKVIDSSEFEPLQQLRQDWAAVLDEYFDLLSE